MRRQFDPARLSPAGRLSFRLFEKEVEDDRAAFRWRWHGFPATNNGSPMGNIPVFLINNHRIDSVADAEAYVARLREVERVMGEIGANIRRQTERGIVPPAFNFAPVREDGRRILAGAPFAEGPDTPLFADFKTKVGRLQIPQAEKDRLIAAAREALTGPFRRGYEAMLATLDAVEPRARGNNGAWSLPDGAAYYAHRLRQSTTTGLSAEQIHRTGLEQVARIHREMERIKAQVGFTGTLQQFFAHINEGQEFKYPNTDEGRQLYLADARAFIAQVMEAAPRWFRRLPRAPLEVRAVEAFRQETAAVAFYNRPSPDGSRPGIFYVNLADMNQVLRPQVEAIAYHEGAPGHHFQIALAQELPGVPKFRRFGGYGVYAEGWGLYAEGLGKEMGFYRQPISEFGMLSTQLWRAIRLVTDTGIHHHRWSRERAIDYFMANGLLSRRDADQGSGALFQQSGPGDQLHDRPAQDIGAARPRPPGARRALRHPRFPRGGARERQPCRSTFWKSWSTNGSHREGPQHNGRRHAPASRPPVQQSAQPAFRHGGAAPRSRHPLQGPRARRRRGILRLGRLDPSAGRQGGRSPRPAGDGQALRRDRDLVAQEEGEG